jgi:hypothetical protein
VRSDGTRKLPKTAFDKSVVEISSFLIEELMLEHPVLIQDEVLAKKI